MKHVIITRMGLARKDDAFYREHLKLCRMTLARSLEAQSDKAFIWAIAIDARAPEWVDKALKELASGVNIEIWRRDPLIHSLNPVDKVRLREIGNGGPVITTRIDDDDLLHCNFVYETHRALSNQQVPTYLTFPHGLFLGSKKAYHVNKPWSSQGLTCLSDPKLTNHAYRFSHTGTGRAAQEKALGVMVLESDRPMWARTMRATSDSAEARRKTPKKDYPSADYIPSEFGLSLPTLWRLRRFLKYEDAAPERPGVTRDTPLPRLHMKLQILRRIRQLREIDPAPEDEIEALATALYSF